MNWDRIFDLDTYWGRARLGYATMGGCFLWLGFGWLCVEWLGPRGIFLGIMGPVVVLLPLIDVSFPAYPYHSLPCSEVKDRVERK